MDDSAFCDENAQISLYCSFTIFLFFPGSTVHKLYHKQKAHVLLCKVGQRLLCCLQCHWLATSTSVNIHSQKGPWAESKKMFCSQIDYILQVIDADKSVDDLHRELKNICTGIIKDVQNKPIYKLWTEGTFDAWFIKKYYPGQVITWLDYDNIVSKQIVFAIFSIYLSKFY